MPTLAHYTACLGTVYCLLYVPKPDGSVQICVDLKPLNANVLREAHPLPTVDNILAQLSGAQVAETH